MYLSKRKIILVISISALVFFFNYQDIKSQDIKITDGDTIKINGVKIRPAPGTCSRYNVIYIFICKICCFVYF